MTKIVFTVPGRPVPKARARTTRAGKSYTPKATKEYEKKVKICALAARKKAKGKLFLGRVGINIAAYRSDKRRYDLSNIVKSIEDALNGVIYEDDHQIHHIEADKGEGLGDFVVVEVYEL